MVYVAADIGASSGRLVLGEILNGKLQMKEIHRFANGFTIQAGTCYWDIDHLLNEILKGLEKVKSMGYDDCTLGIDTWAIDYVLLDHDGKRLQEVVAYRDKRTEKTIQKLTKIISKEDIYHKTGIQFLPFNTIYQLYEEDKKQLERTSKILLVPDYLGYCLTGVGATEMTNASTMQLLNPRYGQFDEELLELISVKKEQFEDLVQPGTELGPLAMERFASYNLPNCKVITVATHDTASAIIGTPGAGEGWAYISSGTWSLLGIESGSPIINELALENNYTNEWGAFKTFRFLKNIMGMWVLQEVRKKLNRDYNFGQFVEEAKKINDFRQFVNFNHDRFLNPLDMIQEIQGFCKETNQIAPESAGELANCIYTNLAIIYAIALDELEQITGQQISRVHIVGGGANNEHLNQLTADVSGKVVYAGPIEATAIGNLLMQMIAAKEVDNLEDARRLVMESFEIKQYTPKEIDRTAIIQKYKEAVSYECTN